MEATTEYIRQYNQLPTVQILEAELQKKSGLSEDDYKEAVDTLHTLGNTKDGIDYLLVETENWCKERALYNAMVESIQVMDGKSKKEKGAIPSIVSEALAVSFDTSVGHDYVDNSADRKAFYKRKDVRVPFGLTVFDLITKGGAARKTLTVFMAGTNVGKSLFMCSYAAHAFMSGKNVLYITLEMARENIAKRIDANLLDIPIGEFDENIDDHKFDRGIQTLKNHNLGRLVIEEFPPATVNVLKFKALLQELKLKKKFVPDIIFIDYLNLATSSRVKQSDKTGSYGYIKSVCEEFRALAVENDVPVITATQFNRKGFGSDNPDLDDVAESFGVPQTADLIFAAVTNPELEMKQALLIIQLKNRDNDVTLHRRFTVKVDRSRMRVFNDPDYDSNKITLPQTAMNVYSQVPEEPKKDWMKKLEEFNFEEPVPSENQTG